MPPIRDQNRIHPSRRRSGGSKKQRKSSSSNLTTKGLVRIIAGTHRGRRIPVLVSDGLRPTGDRVKETLFNWLMSDVTGSRCLDMYAGSGALGIEALSRGASFVTFIEQNTTIVEQLKTNLSTLKETNKSEVITNDARSASLGSKTPYDLVFIDPPFAHNMLDASIAHLISSQSLRNGSLVYIERGHDDQCSLPENFSIKKEITTGQIHGALFEFNT